MVTWPDGWRISLTHPEEPSGPGCQPTVLSKYLYAVPGDLHTYEGCLYRGACFGCGLVGPEREEENPATEDAHDHTHPGWRSLPAIEALPHLEGSRELERRMARLRQELEYLYPEGWAQRCGPIVTLRNPPASRHVPGRSPFGGYDLARIHSEGAGKIVTGWRQETLF